MFNHRGVIGLSLLTLSASACMEQGFVSGIPHSPPGVPLLPIVQITPQHHDFGAPYVRCRLEQPFEVHNVGQADLVIDRISFEAGSEELVLDDPNLLPISVAPGDHIPLSVAYLGVDAVDDYGAIVVDSNDPVRPEVTADVRGAAHVLPRLVDTFEQPFQAKSDILVVIDSSGSMEEEQASLTTNFQAFIDTVVAANADFHMAIITTDIPTFMGPVITSLDPDPVGTFNQQARRVGVRGSGDEWPMQMVHDATQPGGDAGPGGAFLRDDAMLAVIVVTDEPDEFSPLDPVTFVDELVALKHGDAAQVRVHVIGGDVPVPACATASMSSVPLDEVVALSGGQFASVCSDWGATLNTVAAGSVELSDSFTLTDEPYVPSIEVTVNGALQPDGWSYDAATQAVVFDPGAFPPSESVVTVSYEPRGDCD